MGRRSVEHMGSFDAAMDGLWGALNAGLIKLQRDHQGFTGITTCFPLEPPRKQIARPAVRYVPGPKARHPGRGPPQAAPQGVLP
jgi:hypothetical protein